MGSIQNLMISLSRVDVGCQCSVLWKEVLIIRLCSLCRFWIKQNHAISDSYYLMSAYYIRVDNSSCSNKQSPKIWFNTKMFSLSHSCYWSGDSPPHSDSGIQPLGILWGCCLQRAVTMERQQIKRCMGWGWGDFREWKTHHFCLHFIGQNWSKTNQVQRRENTVVLNIQKKANYSVNT